MKQKYGAENLPLYKQLGRPTTEITAEEKKKLFHYQMQVQNSSNQSKDQQNDSNFSLADFMNNTNLSDSGLFGTLNFNNLSTPSKQS